MEQIINDMLFELFGANSIGKTVISLFFAIITWFAIEMYLVANRKPDEEGNISKMNWGYYTMRRAPHIISTIAFIFIFTFILQEWVKNGRAIYVGPIVGVASKGLGAFAVWVGKLVIKFFKSVIGNMAGQNSKKDE